MLAALAGGLGLAVVIGVAKMVRDVAASRRDRPLQPWEREQPDLNQS